VDQSSHRMRVRFLTAGLILCIGLVGIAFWKLSDLSSRTDELDARVDIATRKAIEANAIADALQARSASLESRVESIEEATSITFRIIKPPSVEELGILLPGLYELETSTQYEPVVRKTSPYTITHVVLEIRYEDYGVKLHVGMAKSGWIPTGVYFDYNNDGHIDTDMAMNFVREIPIVGARLARAYDAESAQNLYSIFVSEVENAEYKSTDEIANDAEAASNYTWTFVMDQYEVIESWVLENLPDRAMEDGSRNMSASPPKSASRLR